MLCVLGFFISLTSAPAQSQTLLVDFGDSGSSGRTLGTTLDFQANDANISELASVVDFDFPLGDQTVSSNSNLEVFVDVDVVDPADPSIRSDPFRFAPGNNTFADGTPILDGYYFAPNSLNIATSVSGFDEIASGSLVTLTVYGVGADPNQDGSIEAFYNGTSLGVQSTDGSGPLLATFAQFTFIKDADVNDLEFVNSGVNSPFAVFNGFSMSAVDPAAGGGGGRALIRPVSVTANGDVSNSVELASDLVVPNRGTSFDSSQNVFWNGTAQELVFDYGETVLISDVLLAADNNDTYLIEYSSDGISYFEAFEFLSSDGPQDGGTDILTSLSSFPSVPANPSNASYVGRGFTDIEARFLRITSTAGDSAKAIGEFQAFTPTLLVNGDFELPAILSPGQTGLGIGGQKNIDLDPLSSRFEFRISGIVGWTFRTTNNGLFSDHGLARRNGSLGRELGGQSAYINQWGRMLSQTVAMETSANDLITASIDFATFGSLTDGGRAGRFFLVAGEADPQNLDTFSSRSIILDELSVANPSWDRFNPDVVANVREYTPLQLSYVFSRNDPALDLPITIGFSLVNSSVGSAYWDNASLTLTPPPIGDFDGDRHVDADDIDFYRSTIGLPAGGILFELDLNNDGMITLDDHDLHVTTLAQTSNGETGAVIGDVNLNGFVDVLGDAFILVGNLGGAGPLGYADGDLNADGIVDVLGDAFRLVGNLGLSNTQ
jgi:hypothetical protein